ncbi:MAG: primosomal protein N', partial [Acetobacteraceae bacterium]|nr:primosomal protein N' [Acetobacteraceae bacterium]
MSMEDTPGVAATPRVRVLLPLPLDPGTYDYRIPRGMSLAPGAFVVVPLNRRQVIGVVWDGQPDPDLPAARLKDVIEALEVPPMTASLRRFVEWVAAYTLSPPGAVLRMAMSAPSALEPPPRQVGWTLAPEPPAEGKVRLTPERRRVLA